MAEKIPKGKVVNGSQDLLFNLSGVPYDETSGRDQNGKLIRRHGSPLTPEEVSAREEAKKMPDLIGRSRPDEMRQRADTDG